MTAKLTFFSLQSDFLAPAASPETATANLLGCWEGKQTVMNESPLLIWMSYCCYSSCPDRVFTASAVVWLLSGGLRKLRTLGPSRKLRPGFELMKSWRLIKWHLAPLLTWTRPWTLLVINWLLPWHPVAREIPWHVWVYPTLNKPTYDNRPGEKKSGRSSFN